MRRRDFIAGIGVSAGLPGTLYAQPSRAPVVGLLGRFSSDGYFGEAAFLPLFRQSLKEQGYIVGRDLTIESRWADGHDDQLRPLAEDLLRRQVSVIVASGGTPPAMAAQASTSSVPIIFATGGDPVKLGLVQSLNRPGGNATGTVALTVQLTVKQAELLNELLPPGSAFALLVNPRSPNSAQDVRLGEEAARTIKRPFEVVAAATDSDLDTVFANLSARRIAGLIVNSEPFFMDRSDHIVELVNRYSIIAVFGSRHFAVAGALCSYGPRFDDIWRLAGVYTAQVLKGAKPSDLPVQQATRLDLVLNVKNAESLGLTIPPSFLALADEVLG